MTEISDQDAPFDPQRSERAVSSRSQEPSELTLKQVIHLYDFPWVARERFPGRTDEVWAQCDRIWAEAEARNALEVQAYWTRARKRERTQPVGSEVHAALAAAPPPPADWRAAAPAWPQD